MQQAYSKGWLYALVHAGQEHSNIDLKSHHNIQQMSNSIKLCSVPLMNKKERTVTWPDGASDPISKGRISNQDTRRDSMMA
jgi:hypothetical protein